LRIILINLEEISFDSLAFHSHWSKRIIGLEKFDIKVKTEKEVLREYQHEEWGALLKKVKQISDRASLDMDELYLDINDKEPCYQNGKFYLANAQQRADMHLALYAETLSPYLDGASCLVELGAGYGSKILNLSELNAFSKLPLYAGEYTQSGRELINIFAEIRQKQIQVGHCDFRELVINDLAIPDNAIIFTSYSSYYVPELSEKFTYLFSQFNPKVVVHFEPCFEYMVQESLYGMMCKRYMILNGYAQNLVSVIDHRQAKGEIKTRIRKNVLGDNPYLPISVIEWSPS